MKCLKSAHQVRAFFEQTFPKEYIEQALQYFVVIDELERLHFVMYDPRVIYRLPGQDRVCASDELAPSLARLSITLAFLMSTVLFGRLALLTESRLAEGDIPDRTYAYVATFDVQNALTSLREYQRINGFEGRKEALRRFLSSHGADVGR